MSSFSSPPANFPEADESLASATAVSNSYSFSSPSHSSPSGHEGVVMKVFCSRISLQSVFASVHRNNIQQLFS